MDGILLVSKRTYSISKKMPIVKWLAKEQPLDSIKMPRDFEMRSVNAALDGKSILSEFRELNLNWSSRQDLVNAAEKLLPLNHGKKDVAWLNCDLHIAFIISSFNKNLPRTLKVDSIEELKKELTSNAT